MNPVKLVKAYLFAVAGLACVGYACSGPQPAYWPVVDHVEEPALCVVDRVEEDVAVVESPEGWFFDLPLDDADALLGQAASEGDSFPCWMF